MHFRVLSIIVVALAVTGHLSAQTETTEPHFIQLPNQWSLCPSGKSIPLGDFPAAISISPNGRWAAVMHCGFGQHEVRVLDLEKQQEVSSAPLHNAWVGSVWSPASDFLYVSGGGDDILFRFHVQDGRLSQATTITLPLALDKHKELSHLAASQTADHSTLHPIKAKPRYPAGMALSANRRTIVVAETYGDRLVRAELPNPTSDDRTAHAVTVAQFETGAYPYRVALHPKQPIAYVSLWGGSSVAEVNLRTGVMRRVTTDPHPNELAISPDGTRLFVACANSNNVDVINTEYHKVSERLNAALYPDSPAGSTPNALALSQDGKTLLVANADNNNVAVFNVSERDDAEPLGYIPTGWYPTAVGFSGAGNIVAIAGKGNGSLANPNGPGPESDNGNIQYIGGFLPGAAAFIDFPDAPALARYTSIAYKSSPLRGDFTPVGAPAEETSSPIPRKVGDFSPIRHLVYIIKENRTYDQVFGDMPEGNGDPSLCIFGEAVTPNHHALAREFVLMDNFYCDAEVSADGHEWSMGAYATDYVERTWPPLYGGHGELGYPAEGQDPNGNPEAGHLWDRAKEAGVTYRSYGEWIEGGVDSDGRPSDPALIGHICPRFPEFNMDVLDETKASIFVNELHEFEKTGEMPRLIIIRLPNDHTVGTKVGKRTPRAYVAEHDQGLGTIVEALSRSRFWPSMAVFIVEDDAQNGPDHVDAHRTVALVAGPHVKRGYVDHTFYSTTSMLRTMELILGLQPMSQFDAAARPIYNCFTAAADPTPYVKKAAQVDMTELNGPKAPMAKVSARLNFKREDSNPDVLFNEIIWKSVKGAESEMPAPVRAAFVHPIHGEEKEDEE